MNVGTGVFVLDPYQRFVMIRRARGCGKGMWSLPGGRLEKDETVFECAIREVQEEIGVAIRQGSIMEVAVTEGVHSCCGEQWKTHWLAGMAIPGIEASGPLCDTDEVAEATWATFFSLPEPLWQPHWAQLGQELFGAPGKAYSPFGRDDPRTLSITEADVPLLTGEPQGSLGIMPGQGPESPG